jgi:hypothetical protein
MGRKNCFGKQIEEINRAEDLQRKQKAGKNWVLQGDANTHFYHQYVNGRRRKQTIAFLDSEQGEIRGQKEITGHIVEYYKEPFGHNDPCSMQLGDNFWPENLKVSSNDPNSLICPFSMEEIKDVVMNMKENSAPGPNGFSVSFFKHFWDTIKGDLSKKF